MLTTIYLKNTERTVYDSFSAALRAGWTVLDETYTKYETSRQLEARCLLADFTAYPEVVDLTKRIETNPTSVTLDDFADVNPNVQQELYFLMGAKGVEKLITRLLSSIGHDEDVYALASLTMIRHALLELNSQSTYE